jgi:energy-coupling factor transport system ATP-binding protein
MVDALAVHNLTYQYDDSSDANALFQSFSLSIQKGERVAIVGHNGSGKSTLAKLFLGLLAPTAGDIQIFGETLTADNVLYLRQKIGMVFQNPDNQFVGATVEDDVAFGLENHQVPHEQMQSRIDAALETVGMQAFKNREPHTLSGGQKQRVALASVLALAPDIIILDEATAMLDPIGRDMMMQVLANLQATRPQLTLIAITHDMDEAALADRVIVLDDGEVIADGTPQHVFSQATLLQENGLDLPFASALQTQLVHAPKHYQTEEELVAWLLSLNK